VKDASAPRIESDVKVGKNPHPEIMKEVAKADWREDLKHTEPVHDASDPKIEAWVKVNKSSVPDVLQEIKKKAGEEKK